MEWSGLEKREGSSADEVAVGKQLPVKLERTRVWPAAYVVVAKVVPHLLGFCSRQVREVLWREGAGGAWGAGCEVNKCMLYKGCHGTVLSYRGFGMRSARVARSVWIKPEH